MKEPQIDWKQSRLDESFEGHPSDGECALFFEGVVNYEGRRAGLVDASYLFIEEPASEHAFLEFWDLDGRTCAIYEEIIDTRRREFRHPIPEFLESRPGFLCIHVIALRPEFRVIGLGQAVLREVIRTCADKRTGVVLLDSRPLQRRPRGYDDFVDEVRDLPWDGPEEDQARLNRHLASWRLTQIPRSRLLVAAPEVLETKRSPTWPPGQ